MLINFLRANRNIFAWKPANMPGVPRELIEHFLNVDRKANPKRQHLRRFADDRRDAIKKELAKLLATGFIKEVFHPEWLANPVLVRKKNTNEWRMCVDYTEDILQLRHKSHGTRSHQSSTQCHDGNLCCIEEACPK
jgi:hypothetical protein